MWIGSKRHRTKGKIYRFSKKFVFTYVFILIWTYNQRHFPFVKGVQHDMVVGSEFSYDDVIESKISYIHFEGMSNRDSQISYV